MSGAALLEAVEVSRKLGDLDVGIVSLGHQGEAVRVLAVSLPPGDQAAPVRTDQHIAVTLGDFGHARSDGLLCSLGWHLLGPPRYREVGRGTTVRSVYGKSLLTVLDLGPALGL